MNITIKKCDVCQTDYRNDKVAFNGFWSVLEDAYGTRYDVCLDCFKKIMGQ